MCLGVAVRHPDRVLEKGVFFDHEYLITHNTMGFRCAYVKVEKGHPWHGRGVDDEPVCSILAHGGITASEADVACDGAGDDTGWWIGVDFVHHGDLPDRSLPMDEEGGIFAHHMEAIHSRYGGGKVWTQDLVREHIHMIAAQAAAAQYALPGKTKSSLPS